MTDACAEDINWMNCAIGLAKQAEMAQEVPVGAVVVFDGEIIGEGFNKVIALNDPSAHAEVVAIRAAASHLDNYRLPGVTVYVTLEPCAMCAGVLAHARVARLVYGASDPKTGVIHSCDQLFSKKYLYNNCDVTSGVKAEECGKLLKDFFLMRRIGKVNES
jgi:tRNA(adenine34) deaminase